MHKKVQRCFFVFGVVVTESLSCVQLCSWDFPEYWSGLPFPSPGDLPKPGIEPVSPVLQADLWST